MRVAFGGLRVERQGLECHLRGFVEPLLGEIEVPGLEQRLDVGRVAFDLLSQLGESRSVGPG